MKNIQLAVFEDSPEWLDLVRAVADVSGHTVVAEATSREVALDVVRDIGRGLLFADAIVLDGNLSTSKTNDGSDARAIIEELDACTTPETRPWIIGNAGILMEAYGVTVDDDASKVLNGLIRIFDEMEPRLR